jgi:hypothetical protein
MMKIRKLTKRAPKPTVFRINDCDWWAGYDLESVKLDFAHSLGFTTVAEAEANNVFESPRALTTDELDEPFTEDSSARNRLDQLIAAGAQFPCFFGSIVSTRFWAPIPERLAA